MKKYVGIIMVICFLLSMTYMICAEDNRLESTGRMPGISLNAIETTGDKTIRNAVEGNELISENTRSGFDNVTGDITNAGTEGIDNLDISTLSLGQPTKDEWIQVGALNNGRAGCDTAVVNGELYIIGGLSSTGYSAVIEKYNSNTDIWEEVTTIPNAPKGYAVASCGDNIYIIGGCEGNAYLNDVQVYNTSSGEWGSVPKMIMHRAGAAAVEIENKIYVFGGEDAFGLIESYEYYDLTEGKWVLISTMDSPALNRIDADIYYLKGYIFVLGGTTYYGDNNPASYYLLSDLNNSQAVLDNDYEFQSMVVGADKALFIASNADSSERIAKEIIVDNGVISINNVSINSIDEGDEGASYIMYDGYIYRIGGYASRKYSDNVYKYSLYYGDFSTGGGQVGSNQTEYGSDLVLNVETGHEYLIFMNVKNMSNLDEYEFTIEYTDNSFTIADTCAFTQYRENSKYGISGTDLIVTEKSTSGMSFVTSEVIPNGKTVTKTVNAVILRATSSGQRIIKYSMTKK